MSMWPKATLLVWVAACAFTAEAQDGGRFPAIGRNATPAEVAAWDIDVRPDLKGLPKGSGSVAKGQEVWEAKCASCHGVFGESNEVFNPLVGGTTEADVQSGRVAALQRNDYPGRTTLMKAATVSTLWDYIRRAMPWNAPKSLQTDEVYAVTAYLLNLGRIVPDDFVLSDGTMAEAQRRLPNRNGMTTAHAMWPGKELGGAARPDVNGTACMANCPVDAKITSSMPAFARNAHGNLAEQNRLVGPQRGIETAQAVAPPPAARPQPAAAATGAKGGAPTEILRKNYCTACHAVDRKLVGPSFQDVAKKYAGQGEYLAGKIVNGSSGVWGSFPMPRQSISADEARQLADWLAAGAPQ